MRSYEHHFCLCMTNVFCVYLLMQDSQCCRKTQSEFQESKYVITNNLRPYKKSSITNNIVHSLNISSILSRYSLVPCFIFFILRNNRSLKLSGRIPYIALEVFLFMISLSRAGYSSEYLRAFVRNSFILKISWHFSTLLPYLLLLVL